MLLYEIRFIKKRSIVVDTNPFENSVVSAILSTPHIFAKYSVSVDWHHCLKFSTRLLTFDTTVFMSRRLKPYEEHPSCFSKTGVKRSYLSLVACWLIIIHRNDAASLHVLQRLPVLWDLLHAEQHSTVLCANRNYTEPPTMFKVHHRHVPKGSLYRRVLRWLLLGVSHLSTAEAVHSQR